MQWAPLVGAGLSAIGGIMGRSAQESAAKEAAEQGVTRTTSSMSVVPDWAAPYLSGKNIRKWDTPIMSQEYMDWTNRMGEGQFANQAPVNTLMSMGDLTTAGDPMANLLGIGSQYSQVAPQMLDQDAMAAAQAAQRAPSLMTEPGPRSPAEVYRDRQGAGHWAADWSGGQFGEAWRRGPSKQQRSLDAIEMSDWYRQQQEKNR